MLTVPRGASVAQQDSFAAKYGGSCVAPEAGPPPIDRTLMFIHFRPYLPSCVLDSSDVVTLRAQVTPSTEAQTGKYPEYDRIWDDKTLNVVALFSRADTVEATGDDDEGAKAYADFLGQLRQYLDVPGDAMPIVKTLPDGRTVHVDARMVEHALDASPDIDAWYSARTTEADLILYNGHAGLGANVRSLVEKGQFRSGKYVILSLNACDTFAYLDDTLAKRRAALNPDDPAGTKYMDVISNAMPGYFGDGPFMSMTLIRGLVDPPVTYDDLLSGLDPAQAANVTGEEDNSFVPSPLPSSTPPDHVQSGPVPGDPDLAPEPNDDLAPPTTSHRRASASCNAVPGKSSSGGPALLLLLAWAAARRKRRYAAGA
jgi:MYXO-CTERM domain-containing protein